MNIHYEIRKSRGLPGHYQYTLEIIDPEPNYSELSPIELLKLSIEKWQTIANYLKVHPRIYISERGISTCACCRRYNGIGQYCEGCPVREFTDRIGCENTPYYQFCEEHDYKTALAELNFLKEVLRNLKKEKLNFLKEVLRNLKKEKK